VCSVKSDRASSLWDSLNFLSRRGLGLGRSDQAGRKRSAGPVETHSSNVVSESRNFTTTWLRGLRRVRAHVNAPACRSQKTAARNHRAPLHPFPQMSLSLFGKLLK
jgi:hypothetical protein